MRPALATLLERSRPDVPTSLVVQEFLTRDLPRHEALGEGAQHEVAWALGDLFERAGLHEQAAVCRSALTHETLAVQRWVRSFVDVPEDFWLPALSALGGWREVPSRAALSLSSAQALLDVVGDGMTLTDDGQLPPEVRPCTRRPVPMDRGVPVDAGRSRRSTCRRFGCCVPT